MDTDPGMGAWTVITVKDKEARTDRLRAHFRERGIRAPDVHVTDKILYETLEELLARFYEEGHPYVGIFEDDCEFESNAAQVLATAWQSLQVREKRGKPWNMVYLGGMNMHPALPVGRALWVTRRTLTTHAVVYSRPGIKYALELLRQHRTGSCDRAIRYVSEQFVVCPPVAFQNRQPASMTKLGIHIPYRMVQRLSYEPFTAIVIILGVVGGAAVASYIAALVFAAKRPL